MLAALCLEERSPRLSAASVRHIWPGLIRRASGPRPLAAIFFLLGPLLYVTPLAATTAMPVAAVVAALHAHDEGRLALARELARAWFWLPLFVLMVASAAWALDAPAALLLAFRLAALFAFGVVLVRSLTVLPVTLLSLPLAALAWGLSVTSVVVLADLANGGILAVAMHGVRPGFEVANVYSRGATVHAVMLVPLALGLGFGGRRRLGLIQLLLGALAILSISSLSAKLALGSGIAAGAIVLAVPLARWLFPIVLATAVAGLPFVLPVELTPANACWLAAHKATAMHRIYIWNFAAERIAEHPLLGWGLDAARRIPGGNQEVVVSFCNADLKPSQPTIINTVMPLHPHNGILQVWLELGGLGALVGFGALLVTLVRAFAARPFGSRPGRAAIAAPAMAGTSVGVISFGIWQEWWISALFLAAAVAVAAARLATAKTTGSAA